MLHRAVVSDNALGLLMDRCRATFANPETDGSFTLYADTNRSVGVRYRVPVEMHRAAQKCLSIGAQRLRPEIEPIRVDSRIRSARS